MRRSSVTRALPAVVLPLLCTPSFVRAAESPRLVVGGGSRTVADVAPAEETRTPKSSVASPPPTHKVGRKPKEPRATLPEGVPLSEPNPKARTAVAEGPSSAERASVVVDRELAALRSAEEVLFPQRVRGLDPGWSFELPRSSPGAVSTLGLPLAVSSIETSGPPISAADAEWLQSLTLPDLPVRLDQRVVTYLKFYRDSHRGRTIAAIWARKSGRYVAAMKAELRRAGLPTDLVWLSMIESGHNPTIKSPAGAVGLWQFMPQSGRMYGLTVDRWVDERRDPARATQAAIRFLGDLYQRFGNWELAMGAYNMGYAGMSRAIAKYNTNDYWTLSRLESGIPWETTLYVPKIFALAVVMNNRQAFGLGRIKSDAAVSFDTVLVEAATPLRDVAKAAGTTEKKLRALNPQYLSLRVPPVAGNSTRRWPVAVPLGTGTATAKALRGTGTAHDVVQVRLGDELDSLARSHGVTRARLARENGLSEKERVEPGTVLLLPKGAKLQEVSSGKEAVVVSRSIEVGAGEHLVFYRVLAGDDLEEIARGFSVSTSDLARWNALDQDARLRSGMTLQVVVPKDRKLSLVRHFDLSSGRQVLVAGSPEFHRHFEGLKGKRRVEIIVRRGDSLGKLGKRYGMSVGSMERVNRRSRRTPLVPGERLIVYTKRAVSDAARNTARQELPELKAAHPDILPRAGRAAVE